MDACLFSLVWSIRLRAIVFDEVRKLLRAHKQRYTDLDIRVKESTFCLSFPMCLVDVCLVVVPSERRGLQVLFRLLCPSQSSSAFSVERFCQSDCYRPPALSETLMIICCLLVNVRFISNWPLLTPISRWLGQSLKQPALVTNCTANCRFSLNSTHIRTFWCQFDSLHVDSLKISFPLSSPRINSLLTFELWHYHKCRLSLVVRSIALIDDKFMPVFIHLNLRKTTPFQFVVKVNISKLFDCLLSVNRTCH